MQTVKLGSKGETVVTLQKLLGITQDGIFGQGTQAKVIEFQKSKGLTADGIVGNKTWEALGVGSGQQAIATDVILSPLPQCTTIKANRPITYLVIHFVGSSNSKPGRALSVRETFLARLKGKSKGSADFAVDDRDIVQFNPDIKNRYCWAVGGSNYNNKGGRLFGTAKNTNCISIEVCSTCTPSTSQAVSVDNHAGWSFTDAALANARKLAKMLMQKYSIDRAHVIRHYDVNGKPCPGIVGWNDEPIRDINGKKTGEQGNSKKWQAFLDSLL